jgi:hypothetical protein
MVQRSGDCLDARLGEIAETVKMPFNCGKAKRPYEALLQFGIESGYVLCRIGGRL